MGTLFMILRGSACLLVLASPFSSLACSNPKDSPSEPEAGPSPRLAESKDGIHSLAVLQQHRKWSGDRLRVIGIEPDGPKTASAGAWRIEFSPTADSDRIEMRGLLFSGRTKVELDLKRNVLTIDGDEFSGSFIEGNSPLARGMAFRGYDFRRESGSVWGRASIILLKDGRLVMDFDKVFVGDQRAREYGILSPDHN